MLCENVTGIINLGLDQVLSDLASETYSCQTLIIPACAVNASHRRDRVWIIARRNAMGNSEYNGSSTAKESRSTSSISDNSPQGENKAFQLKGTSGRSNIKNVANTAGKGWERRLHRGQNPQRESQQGLSGCGSTVRIKQEQNWWAVEPDVGRVAHGIPNRVDRLKQLGNAVVPQVVEQIGRAIMQIEENE